MIYLQLSLIAEDDNLTELFFSTAGIVIEIIMNFNQIRY